MNIYSFGNFVLLVNGVEASGFAEGDDAITIRRRTDSASDTVGPDGNMMISVSADKSGEVILKLQIGSRFNKYLSGLVAAMETFPGRGFVPVYVMAQDTYRNDLATGANGYIKKPAEQTRGAKATEQEWTIVVERLDQVFGDSATF